LVWFFVFCLPVKAVSSSPVVLNLELLESRLQSPVLIEGFYVVDLSNFVINLTDDNTNFRNQFYQLIQSKLNQSKQPLGLDLSHSIIRGDFQLNKLGFLTSFDLNLLSPFLTSLEEEKITTLLPLFNDSNLPFSSVNIFRGLLNLTDSRFYGKTDFSNTLFLQGFQAKNVYFTQSFNCHHSIFTRLVDFNHGIFGNNFILTNNIFLDRVNFQFSQFKNFADFQSTRFNNVADFSHSQFGKLTNFSQTIWQSLTNFNFTNWLDRVIFSKVIFADLVDFSHSTFEESANFRDSLFNQSVNFTEVSLFDILDFSNSIFPPNSYLNVDHIACLSDSAKILGDSGFIGKIILIPILNGNENVFRNLIHDFRSFEQVSDANSLEYQQKQLQQKQLQSLINNTFLDFQWFLSLWSWFWLTLLLLLSHFGTNFSLVFSVGLIAISYFGVLFWYVDRIRINSNISLPLYEVISVITTYLFLTFFGLISIFNNSDKPWLTLTCLSFLLFPIPLLLLFLLRKYNNPYLPHRSYLVEDGEKRQIRLLIVRLPIIPRFDFYRNRYLSIQLDKKWNWLNYYDFSLNNILKFGFNDLRLRDEYLPGIISTLVWYQWSLGIFYIILLFWTLSRTIPGLNLLIYI
jgi:hypothetical protein